jgi:serine/threonine-protein kinase
MPFIDGETLRAKLDRDTQLGVDEAVQLSRDVADALHYAHTHGVIHRDIKPENILIANGRPMVADFGIALALSAAAGGRMTETGLSIGTPHYMSPEQATAEKDISARSDVYSLASVLYEMLTGSPPHTGASAQQVIMKIISEVAAPVTLLRKSVPPNVAAAVAKALEKLPADRFETAKAFAEALVNPAFTTARTAKSPSPTVASVLGWRAATVVLGTTVAVLAVLALWLFRRPVQMNDSALVRFSIGVPLGVRMQEDEAPNVTISPDGAVLVYASGGMLHKRTLDAEMSEALPGTEGAYAPFFSSNGQSIAFSQDNEIRAMSIAGGPKTHWTTSSLLGADWGDDGTIVHSTRGGLWRTMKAGAKPKQITTLGPGETEHVFPQMVSGTQILIFTVLGHTALWSDARVVALDLASGKRVVLRENATHARFVAPDRLLFADANGTVSAIRFDPARMETAGEPVPIATGVRVASWGGGASYAVSKTGTLVFVRGSSLGSDRVWWLDRTGRRKELGEPMTAATLLLSPNQRHIITDPFLSSALDVWLMDPETGGRDRFTLASPGSYSYESPVWSFDGARIAYAFQISDSMQVHARNLDGTGDARLFTRQHHHHLSDWSPDGAWVLATELHPERNADVVAIGIDPKAGAVNLSVTSATEDNGRFSPDGRWVAYQSDESGRLEVYVVAFPSGEGRRQVSTNGGQSPRWSRSSRELFYWQDSTLMAVRVKTQGAFERTIPSPLLTMSDADPSFARWDAAADGQRFLVAGHNPNSLSRELHVVLNWTSALGPPVGR